MLQSHVFEVHPIQMDMILVQIVKLDYICEAPVGW